MFGTQLRKRMPNYLVGNFLPHIHFVATVPCKILRHKSDTFHVILALCTMFFIMSIKFTEISIDKTNKIHP